MTKKIKIRITSKSRKRPLRHASRSGFTLMELLVVIAIIAIVAGMVLPGTRVNHKSKIVRCMHNVKQIHLGLQLYAGDSADAVPHAQPLGNPMFSLVGYKSLMKHYVGLTGPSSSRDTLFACPADTFHYDGISESPRLVKQGLHEQAISDYSSYAFNGANAANPAALGISGRTLASIREPSKTVLVAEACAYVPWSWHRPKLPLSHENALFPDAMCVLSFVDGHADYRKMYWDVHRPGRASSYDPPENYAYCWSAD